MPNGRRASPTGEVHCTDTCLAWDTTVPSSGLRASKGSVYITQGEGTSIRCQRRHQSSAEAARIFDISAHSSIVALVASLPLRVQQQQQLAAQLEEPPTRADRQ